MDESGMVPDIVSVSAKTGANTAALHTAIVRQLAELPASQAAREQSAPRLYVDRVFTANGTGTVLTGTLQQGSLKVGTSCASTLPIGRCRCAPCRPITRASTRSAPSAG